MLIRRMLDQREGHTAIASAVLQRTGERVSHDSIRRYAAHYRFRKQIEQQARQHTDKFLDQARLQGDEIGELLQAAFLEAFTAASLSGSLRELNPLHLEAAHRKRRELDLKEKHMLLSERRVEVYEQRFQLDRQKKQADLDKFNRKAQSGQSLTAEDVRRIKEIYGIYEDISPDEAETEIHDDDSQENGQ